MDYLTPSTQLEVNFGPTSPSATIPLAHISIPTVQIPYVVSTQEQSKENVSGLYSKYLGQSATLQIANSTVGMAATGVLTFNKLNDGTFKDGLTYWGNSVGSVLASTTEGRTSENSTYSSESVDRPAFGQDPMYQPYCAWISWNSNGYDQLISDKVAAAVGDEANYAKENRAYQLSLWIKTDPVDSHGYRRGPDDKVVDIRTTRIVVEVIGYDSSDNVTEVCASETISWFDAHKRFYLNKETPWFLRFRTPLFRISEANTEKLGVVITCTSGAGIYFDDIVLTSFVYAQSIRVSSGDAPLSTETVTLYLPGGWENTDMADINQTFNNNSNNTYVLESAGNLVINSGFEDGTNYQTPSNWTGTATREPGIGISGTYGLLLDTHLESVQQEFSVNYAQDYTAQLYYRAKTKYRDNPPKVILIVEALTSADVVVATYSATGEASGAYENPWKKLSVDIDFGGNNTIEKARYTITISKSGNKAIYVDDAKFISPEAAITGWYVYNSQNYYSTFFETLGSDRNNYLLASAWLSGTSEDIRHYIIPYREHIFADAEYSNIDITYSNKYWNTFDKLESESISIDPTKRYKIAMYLGWSSEIPGATNISSLFSVPYRIKYWPVDAKPRFSFAYTDTNRDIIKVIEYGNISLNIEYFDSGGNSLGTTELADISPRNNNLPKVAIKHIDPETNTEYPMYYSEPVKTSLLVPPENAATCKLYISMRGTRCGVKQIWMAEFSEKQNPQTGTITFTGLSGGEDVEFYSFTDALKVERVEKDISGAWFPVIKDGIFERSYTVTSSEPSGGILARVGWETGSEISLIYTIPEFYMEPRYNAEEHITEAYQIEAESIDEHTVFLRNINIDSISYLCINNTVIVSGSPIKFTELPSNYTTITAVNAADGTIILNRSINPRDKIIASYTYKQYRYVYRGFYENGIWHDIDLNPTAGHRFHIGVDGHGIATSELINNGITIYAIPTASVSGNSDGQYIYKSHFSIDPINRPSHYIKHVIGTDVDNAILSKEPYAVILAKIFIVPPCTLSDIKILDLRPRGGGLPDNWDNPPTFQEEFRLKLNCESSDWLNTRVQLAEGDILSIKTLGRAFTGDGYTTVSPSGLVFGYISSTMPSTGTTGFHIGENYSSTITSATSGILYTRVVSTESVSGYFYLTINTSRKTEKRSRWDTSSWEGEPVMLNGVAIVELPKEILTGENGYTRLTATEIEEIVNKHVAGGVLPIVRYT